MVTTEGDYRGIYTPPTPFNFFFLSNFFFLQSVNLGGWMLLIRDGDGYLDGGGLSIGVRIAVILDSSRLLTRADSGLFLEFRLLVIVLVPGLDSFVTRMLDELGIIFSLAFVGIEVELLVEADRDGSA